MGEIRGRCPYHCEGIRAKEVDGFR